MTTFAEILPRELLQARRGTSSRWTYSGEMELTTVLAAMAQSLGLECQTQVPLGMGAIADLVVTDDHIIDVVEVKLELRTRRELRRAAEQVLSYGRQLRRSRWDAGAEDVVVRLHLVAPVLAAPSSEALSEFEQSYVEVEAHDLRSFMGYIRYRSFSPEAAVSWGLTVSTALDLCALLLDCYREATNREGQELDARLALYSAEVRAAKRWLLPEPDELSNLRRLRNLRKDGGP